MANRISHLLLAALPLLLALTVAGDTPNEYSLTSFSTPDCSTPPKGGAKELFDNNEAGDTKCHAILPQSSGKTPQCIQAYSHNLCVYLYPEGGCTGQGSLVSSQWGYCTGGNGTQFGKGIKGPGADWVPKSYMVNDGSVTANGFPLPPVFPYEDDWVDDAGLRRREKGRYVV